MRFDPMLCPECGGAAEEVVEMVLGGAGITLDPETGEYEEAGDTSISWDSQERLLQDGKVRLVCHNQHEWLAEEVYPTSIVCQHLAAAEACWEHREMWEVRTDLEKQLAVECTRCGKVVLVMKRQ